jgi:uncharacterized protein YndB with AHSA1/START domain
MASATERPNPSPALKTSRTFPAPRALVFEAWSTAEHVTHWFSPRTYAVAAARVEMRVGGAFDVCMRAPDGMEHWTRGRIVELDPGRRLVIEMQVLDHLGALLFTARTEVEFLDADIGTRLEVIQTYDLIVPAMAAGMVAGAEQGWRETLDKLGHEIYRMGGGGSVGRSVAHGIFHLERAYTAPLDRVWRALTDPDAKAKWFGGPPGQWEPLERYMDVRPGGRERLKVRWHGGLITTFDATYHDVIPDARLVYSYEMHLDESKISVSLATMQLKAEGDMTRLLVTEQGAFLDGYDDAGSREHGTGQLLDQLGLSL